MQLDITLADTLRTAIALLFSTGVTHKLWNIAEFQRTVGQYMRGLGAPLPGIERPLSLAVVLLEIAIVAACLLPGDGRIAAVLASGTLLLYALAMTINLLRDNDLPDCGCNWGKQPQPVESALVIRNGVLALIAIAAALPVTHRELSIMDIASIIFATIAAVLLYAAANHALVFAGPARRNY
jgi:uncharacterized membrane protein YphA (DoxX/SURF4 family)